MVPIAESTERSGRHDCCRSGLQTTRVFPGGLHVVLKPVNLEFLREGFTVLTVRLGEFAGVTQIRYRLLVISERGQRASHQGKTGDPVLIESRLFGQRLEFRGVLKGRFGCIAAEFCPHAILE